MELRTGESCGEGATALWSGPPGRGRAHQKVGSLFFAFPTVPSKTPATQQVLAEDVFLHE